MARPINIEGENLHASNVQRMVHEDATSAEERKGRGQVFTPPEICAFMASLVERLPSRIRILDPGAGTGSLSAALCDRIAALPAAREVELHLYETDPLLEDGLRASARRWERKLAARGHKLRATIHTKDFVLAHAHLGGAMPLFAAPTEDGFDVVIMNPPYFKVAGDSRHARLFPELIHGQPNIYAIFLALAAELLRPHGQLVAITPRSFCNGLYFRSFRRWMLARVRLTRAHLFDSRRDAFRESEILQESLITVFTKAPEDPTHHVTVSASHGRADLGASRQVEVAARDVVDDSEGHAVLRLPSSMAEAQLLRLVDRLPHRLETLGLRVSTGPVVSFRAREFLVDEPRVPGTVPLIQVGNVKPFHTLWPVKGSSKPASFRDCDGSRSLLLPASNYVLMRRFSAKEEARRLTASCFLREDCPTARVAFENHVNYLYRAEGELTHEEVFGLAALFNSRLMDRYFRCLSGNTQVNATELRSLPMPSMEAVAKLARDLDSSFPPAPEDLERAVLHAVGVRKGEMASFLGALV